MRVEQIHANLPPTQGAKVALYMLQHTDPDTRVFSRTYKQIQKDTGVPAYVIADTLKRLSSVGLIQPVGVGRWLMRMIAGYDTECDGLDYFVDHLGP